MHKIKEYWSIAGALSVTAVKRLQLFSALLTVPLFKKVRRGKPVPLTLSFNNTPFVLAVRDGADIAMLREVFVDGEYKLRADIAPKSILDIGGNMGDSAAYFAAIYPEASIVVYEPDPANFALLKKNMEQFPQVTCVEAAVAGATGERVFYKNNTSSVASSLLSRGGKEEQVTVHTVSLNDLVREHSADLVKFDVEGGEYDLFVNTDRTKLPPTMVGEVHYDLMPCTKEDFLALFPGYTSEERSLSAKRSIVAWYR